MRTLVLLVSLVVAVVALPADMPEPGEMAFKLNEEEFEDYLDAWLAKEEPKWGEANRARSRSATGCTFKVNEDLGQPQPVYIHGDTFLSAYDNTGQIRVNSGDVIKVSCTGSGRSIQHPNMYSLAGNHPSTNVTCLYGNFVYAQGWDQSGTYRDLVCSSNSVHVAEDTGKKCFNNNSVLRVGYIVDNVFHPWYHSCFDRERMEVLYVWYDQNAGNTIHQTNVNRPNWQAGTFFPGYNVNDLYKQVDQKIAIANIVGDELADEYVTARQFLARGHLAAKSDYVFATGQRASFYFINAAPQWQPFNAGNWNWLEQNLRARIGQANYDTVIYTGTFGVTQLRDANGKLQDIYLVQEGENHKLPVPMYFYKVAYDAKRRLGTAFVSINNPYYTPAEARSLQFCTDHCRNNAAFSWLRWHPDDMNYGYSFCCTVADFKKVVPHLPAMNVVGLLA